MTKNTWIILAAAVVVALIGLAIWQRPAPSVLPGNAASTTYSVGDNDASTSALTATGTVTAEYRVIGKWDAASAPSYKTPINYSKNVDATLKEGIQSSLAKTIAALNADPEDFQAWINLGTIHKMAGDYSFAETVWIYMSKVFPTSETPFFNLASLYDYQLKDYPKAEANYLQAIKNNPHDTTVYHDLAVLYEYKYKTDTNSAETVLKQGIAANPKSYDLQVTLAEYYVQKSRIADAKAEYQAAIANAKAQGYTSAAASIQADLDKLQ